MIQLNQDCISSKEWELDSWLKKYNLSQTAWNKRSLLRLMQDTKDFYLYGLTDPLPVNKLDRFYRANKEHYSFE